MYEDVRDNLVDRGGAAVLPRVSAPVTTGATANASAYTREQFLKGQIDVLPAAQGRSPIRQQLSQK